MNLAYEVMIKLLNDIPDMILRGATSFWIVLQWRIAFFGLELIVKKMKRIFGYGKSPSPT